MLFEIKYKYSLYSSRLNMYHPCIPLQVFLTLLSTTDEVCAVATVDTDKCVPSAFPAFLPPYCSFCLELCPTPTLSAHAVLSHQCSPWHGAHNQVNANQVLHPLPTGLVREEDRRGDLRWCHQSESPGSSGTKAHLPFQWLRIAQTWPQECWQL